MCSQAAQNQVREPPPSGIFFGPPPPPFLSPLRPRVLWSRAALKSYPPPPPSGVDHIIGPIPSDVRCCLADQVLYMWGSNAMGELGLGTSGGAFPRPEVVSLPGGAITHIALGQAHTLAVVGMLAMHCRTICTTADPARMA